VSIYDQDRVLALVSSGHDTLSMNVKKSHSATHPRAPATDFVSVAPKIRIA